METKNTNERAKKIHLKKDLLIISVNVIITLILSRLGFFDFVLYKTQNIPVLSIFTTGLFFISIFTALPATILLGKLAQIYPILTVAIFGALGALIGDLFLFLFIKEKLVEDFLFILKETKSRALIKAYHSHIFRWLMPVLGAFVILSPLPDELGIAMMGVSQIKTVFFVPLSFSLNFISIFLIGLLGKTV